MIRRLTAFVLCAYGFTWTCWLPVVAEAKGWIELRGQTEVLSTLGQFGPFVAAFLCAAFQGKLAARDVIARFVRWRVSPVCYVFALFFPPVAYAIAIILHAMPESPPIRFSQADMFEVLPHFLITLLIGGPLGEEPGWRGYALPMLHGWLGSFGASLILAIIWACWHLPLWWVADVPCSFPVYVLCMIPLTYLFTWLAERSGGSLLLALLFHASLNTSLVRMPIFPAFHVWIVICWITAVVLGSVSLRVKRVHES
jgi:membrane protease YdiL (CAAX protease family)